VRIFGLIDPVFVLELILSQAVSTACFVLATKDLSWLSFFNHPNTGLFATHHKPLLWLIGFSKTTVVLTGLQVVET
jgi:hypothetical protein